MKPLSSLKHLCIKYSFLGIHVILLWITRHKAIKTSGISGDLTNNNYIKLTLIKNWWKYHVMYNLWFKRVCVCVCWFSLNRSESYLTQRRIAHIKMLKSPSIYLSITPLLYLFKDAIFIFFSSADLMFCRTFTSVHFIVQTSCLSINLNNILFRNCGAMEMTCVSDCHCCETPSPTYLPFSLSRPS